MTVAHDWVTQIDGKMGREADRNTLISRKAEKHWKNAEKTNLEEKPEETRKWRLSETQTAVARVSNGFPPNRVLGGSGTRTRAAPN